MWMGFSALGFVDLRFLNLELVSSEFVNLGLVGITFMRLELSALGLLVLEFFGSFIGEINVYFWFLDLGLLILGCVNSG